MMVMALKDNGGCSKKKRFFIQESGSKKPNRHFIIKQYIALIAIGSFLSIASASFSNVVKKHNTLVEIKQAEGRIGLKLLREWGGDKEADLNKLFFEPRDVAFDKSGNIFILEGSRINIFDKKGQYIRTLGRRGQGPGEFFDALSLDIDSDNNLVVYDSGNRRIQILDANGANIGNIPLGSYDRSPIIATPKKEILMFNSALTTEPAALLQFYNYQGKLLKEAGVRSGANSDWGDISRQASNISQDKGGKIFAATPYRPIFGIYSESGDLEKEITYELPFEVPEMKSSGMKAESVSSGIAVDNKNRIYILANTRRMNREERNIGSTTVISKKGGGLRSSSRVRPNVDPSASDLFQILIFDEFGKIISSNRLDCYSEKIRIYDNHLFLIDGYINMNIREYQILN